MSATPLKRCGNVVQNEAGPKVRQHHSIPEHATPDKEVNNMPFEHEYGDSAPKCNREHSENWQSIGDLAAQAVRKAGGE